MTTRALIAKAWLEVDDMLADAIADHRKRRDIVEKLISIRTAERVYFTGKLEDCERRISNALALSEQERTG